MAPVHSLSDVDEIGSLTEQAGSDVLSEALSRRFLVARSVLHDLSSRAIAAALTTARVHGLRCDDPVVLADGSNVIVYLRPAPVVAKVATTTALVRQDVEAWVAREVAVARCLEAQGASILQLSRELPPGPHQSDDFWISFWELATLIPAIRPTDAEAVHLLDDLHGALNRIPESIPIRPSPFTELPVWLTWLEQTGSIGAAHLEWLWRDVEKLGEEICFDRGSARVLHGDAHPANILATDRGFLWADFEEVCHGPREWDLVCCSRNKAPATESSVETTLLQSLRDVRTLQSVLWRAVTATRFPACRDRAAVGIAEWIAGRERRGRD